MLPVPAQANCELRHTGNLAVTAMLALPSRDVLGVAHDQGKTDNCMVVVP